MVVILIIGLLATIVVQNLRSATDKAKRVKAQADIAQFKSALDRYYLDAGSIRPATRDYRRWSLHLRMAMFRATGAVRTSRKSRRTLGGIRIFTKATEMATR